MRNRIAVLALLTSNSVAGAQSLAQRVTSADGVVHVVFPARSGVCGDGVAYIGNVFGQSSYYSGNSVFNGGHGSWERRPCEHGPVRIAATVMSGEVTRLRPYVGPMPRLEGRVLDVSAADATTWLNDLIAKAPSKLAEEAMFPLVIADGADPWPSLLRVARDENRPLQVRRGALHWLGTGVADKLGLSNDDADTDDDEMRKQAVFVLSQRPKSESVPELMSLARSAKYPSVRRQAIFWLGQTGDMRAADTFAELLKLR
jgi:hypothetical protein